jgi:adenine-specific DNA methylase/REP element-mobilizing transposase RayT
MIPKECKRLAEVDFPVAEVSHHSAREKSIRHGHPSTLHLWWARRPLAACRAMLMALLLPDPCDVNCPAEFREEARRLLKPMPNCGATGSNKELRDALLKFIADFANWDNSAKPAYLECARGLVKAAHGEEPPLVVDPFAGGGSIPLEALRLGCDAFASDLNPVACLILKVLLEDIPRHGPRLAEELRAVGKQIKEEAEKELTEFYPPDPDGARPIAYLWARTVRCEAVGCGAEIPLMRSSWLCKKANRRRALRLRPLADTRGSAPSCYPTREPSRERERAAGIISERTGHTPERAVPLAYLITFTCYGTWLHGKDPLSVDRDHNVPRTPFLAPDPEREESELRRMDQPPYELDVPRRQIVLDAIREVCEYRGWELLAAHVRTTHVHVVVTSTESPERMMNDFKGYASRRLNEAGFENAERKRWTRHGSTPYLWKPRDVEAAVHYVVHEQGEPMAVFDRSGEDRSLTLAARSAAPIGEARIEFEIFAPESESEVRGGTVTRGNALCPCCNSVLPVARVRDQLRAQRGGADVIFDDNGERIGGARLLAVVTLAHARGSDSDGSDLASHAARAADRAAIRAASVSERGRQYRLPTQRDYEAVWRAQKQLEKLLDDWERSGRQGLCPVPDEPTPAGGGSGAGRAFSVQRYGMLQWGDLFTGRQKFALTKLAGSVRSSYKAEGIVSAVREILALAFGRFANASTSLCRWHNSGEKLEGVFSRQALPLVWDFCEGNPYSEATGGLDGAVEWSAAVAEAIGSAHLPVGQAQPCNATDHPIGTAATHVWFTDPPYYDAVPYADLSDFFFVWLRRTLPHHPLLRNTFEPENPLTPKCAEIVEDEVKHTPDGRPKDKDFFEESMQKAFAEGRRVLREDAIGSVVFAHKTTEGWEALISGMLRGGWTVTGSWPITTEMANRLRARESAALAASVHLVCRPRPQNAGIGGWEEILRDLPNRIGDWMERLSGEGIRGADLVFSCIGPALELFSKYDKVETAEGREVKLDEFLAKVWEVVGRTALQQILGTAEARARNSAAGALEEDARLTALFLWTLQSTNGEARSQKSGVRREEDEEETEDEEEEKDGGKAKKGYVLIYDVARRFAQPLGIHLENWEGRIIETKKGVVRLIPVTERAEQLFGQAGTEAVARAIERSQGESPQFTLFPHEHRAPDTPIKTRKGGRRFPANHPLVPSSGEEGSAERGVVRPAAAQPREATTLDRVHRAMLLQAGGQATALRAMLEAETQRSPDFLRLANALSALYPKDSEEKRLLDAMLVGVRS